MLNIKSYFKDAVKRDASDLHLVGGELPALRIEGELTNLSDKKLNNKELESAIMGLLTKEQQDKYKEEKELDLSYEQDDVRFRVNLHQQNENIGLSARLIPSEVPTVEDLHFEPILTEIPNLLDGLVLVTGPTGCGKSTTLAAMIEHINKTRKAHIVTVEDPVEFMFTKQKKLRFLLLKITSPLTLLILHLAETSPHFQIMF